MSLITFKISWEEDDTIFRIIEALSGQSYYELHEGIKKHFQLPTDMHAILYVLNSRGIKERKLDSTVEKNKKDAESLSMKKTPIGALLQDPHQQFEYVCEHIKKWTFTIDTIALSEEQQLAIEYPLCVKSEGISPSLLGAVPDANKDAVMEIEEKYDLGNADGFGDEGDDTAEDADEFMNDEDASFSEEI
ncbi:MAG: hypothetical protein R2831_02230 [Chitinophagaceae bacterium]